MTSLSSMELQTTADEEVAETLRLRVLRNERIIGTVLLVFVLLMFAVTVAEMTLGSSMYTKSELPLLVTWVLLTVYAVLLRQLAGRALRLGNDLPQPLRFASAIFEPLLVPMIVIAEGRAFPVETYSLFGPAISFQMFVVVASVFRLSRTLSFCSGAVAGIAWTVLSAVLISRNPDADLPTPFKSLVPHVANGVFLCLVGLCVGLIAAQVRRALESTLRATHEQHRIRMTFGRHVSPKVAEALLNAPDAGATQTRFVTVMFLDVRGFTAFSEARGPEDVVAALESILAICVSTIEEYDGVVNKFLGDGLLAVFGAPLPSENPAEDTRRCVEASGRILERLDAVRAARLVPDLDVGIGVHCGEAVVGTVGPRDRREYTLIGDTVNLASRIEGLNKELGARVLVSQAVWDLLRRGPAPQVLSVAVKNRTAPVAVVKVA